MKKCFFDSYEPKCYEPCWDKPVYKDYHKQQKPDGYNHAEVEPKWFEPKSCEHKRSEPIEVKIKIECDQPKDCCCDKQEPYSCDKHEYCCDKPKDCCKPLPRCCYKTEKCCCCKPKTYCCKPEKCYVKPEIRCCKPIQRCCYKKQYCCNDDC